MAGLFPRWMNVIPTLGAIAGGGGTVVVIAGGWYYLTPDFFEVGYMPTQPESGFNHQIHAGRLGMDCRYCHTHVEDSTHANVPSVHTCMGCHGENKLAAYASEDHVKKTDYIRRAYAEDESIPWRRIHLVPDYAHFPHNVHVAAGVSCYSCHGAIPGMVVVHQAESLSMGWCLDCHRNPADYLVPPDKVTDLMWVESEWFSVPVAERSVSQPDGTTITPVDLANSLSDAPPQHCAACHH